MKVLKAFYLQKDNLYAVPVTHYNMEMAAQVRLAFLELQPACVAVELAETMHKQLIHAASRLPDISVVLTPDSLKQSLLYLCEPCDAAFEGLRSALEAGVAAYCIDLDIAGYPDVREALPDPYAVQRVGLKNFYQAYIHAGQVHGGVRTHHDVHREVYMAKRLKELSLQYDSVLFVGGMSHLASILDAVERTHFETVPHESRGQVQVCTLTEKSCREVMAEFPWMTVQYEKQRANDQIPFSPDRQRLILRLLTEAAEQYVTNTGCPFAGYHYRNLMKFLRNYALLYHQLMPDLFQILSASKGCVDHNFAYEVWALATEYPYRRNVDNLPELNLTAEDVWGKSKIIRFHRKEKSRKPLSFQKRAKDRSDLRFLPPGPFAICSYPPEDIAVEQFGDFLKKKGTQLFTEETARTIPFTTSIEDGIDTKETIRHWHQKKLYVKVNGKPPGAVGSIVVIFDEDFSEDERASVEIFPWKTTWLGEHSQESDMAFYATDLTKNVVGPGISRCEYGGFMMSYPPRRLFDVWSDQDYCELRNKPEVLLAAAIDYALCGILFGDCCHPRGSMYSR